MTAYVKPVWSKTTATVNHPTLEAVVGGLYRFRTQAQAQRRLEAIKKHFILSKDQPEDGTLRLWIKGYELTEEQKEEGYTGHFGVVHIVPMETDVYTIQLTKLDIPLNMHPQKKRPKQRHPDWGHPLLRAVKKRPVYATVEEAQAMILAIHQEFPEVSIPCTNKMYIMIYSKDGLEPGKSPVRKYVFEVKLADNGGFILDYFINPNPKRRKGVEGEAAAPASDGTAVDGAEAPAKPAAPQGYFTSMVQLKRSNKRKVNPLDRKPAPAQSEGGEAE